MDTTALVTTLVLAIAGPVGIVLGWWLGRRAERDKTGRDERKNAYVRFTSASIKFRNADDAERVRRRDERWEALAVLTMVAPPAAVRIAGNMQPLHIIYTVVIGFLAQFVSYEWKGRRVK